MRRRYIILICLKTCLSCTNTIFEFL